MPERPLSCRSPQETSLGNWETKPRKALRVGIPVDVLGEMGTFVNLVPRIALPTRCSTTLSSKVNLHHAINFRALCGANLVTQPSKI